MDDTTNQGMSNLSSRPMDTKPADPIVPGGPPVNLSSDPALAQPVAVPLEPAFGVAPAESAVEDSSRDDGDIKATLKRIEDKLETIALKVGA